MPLYDVQCCEQHVSLSKTAKPGLSTWLGTPLMGMVVRAKAVLKEIDGRRLVFEVSASDEVELIGEGTHERFIVNRARFEERIRDKGSK
jgi:predicted thioesterase